MIEPLGDAEAEKPWTFLFLTLSLQKRRVRVLRDQRHRDQPVVLQESRLKKYKQCENQDKCRRI